MRVLQYSRYGDPEVVIESIEVEAEPPGPGEVWIAVEATPLTFNDLYCMRGLAGFRPPLPAVPGGRGIGRVSRLGASVDNVHVGTRVYLPRTGGTWRDVMRVPAAGLMLAPEQGDLHQLALLNSNVITAYALLKLTAPLRAGDWVIQNGAASSCGRYIAGLAKRWGIRTINVVRRQNSRSSLAGAGTENVLLDDDRLHEAAREASAGAPVRVGFDMVGGPSTGRLAACLADRGRLACYGNASGQPAVIPVSLLLFRHLTVFGFLSEDQMQQAGLGLAEIAAIYREMSELVADGTLRSDLAAVYPFSRVREAIRHQSRERDGKILLVPK
jgi:NADPH:quinone reductase-like Zn-dependent oxidoreductase